MDPLIGAGEEQRQGCNIKDNLYFQKPFVIPLLKFLVSQNDLAETNAQT